MSDTWIDIFPDSLPIDRAVAFVADPRAGGIDVFLGTTRTEKNAKGNDLVALDYEAYTAMAVDQLHNLAGRARKQWPIIKLAMLHRIGRVDLAEPSVVIAVSTPHRAQAFDACRFLIDELKKEITIWKKEVWTDGATSWIHPDSR